MYQPANVSEKRTEKSLCHRIGNFSFDFIDQRSGEVSSKKEIKASFIGSGQEEAN